MVLALFSSPAVAAPPQATASDPDIKAQVETRLFDAGLIGIRVAVRDRVVTLDGAVLTLRAKEQAVAQARKVHGVAGVVSNLEVRPGESDEFLATAIADAIASSRAFTIFDDVNVHVRGGVATLTGFVTSGDKTREFVKEASAVPGVTGVIAQIEPLPALVSDDQLRYAIAVAIYGSDALAPYSVGRMGPIHIIVRRGKVMLTGVVRSEMDRRMAGNAARQVFGVGDVDNQLRIED
jgi:osmotically-inducible protein OsmY